MISIPLTNIITFHSNNWLLLPDANQIYLNIWLSKTLTFIKKQKQKQKHKLHLNISIALFWGAPKSLQMVIAAMKLKEGKESYDQRR